MPNWPLLTAHLRNSEPPVRLAWEQLEQIVGPLPSSASTHRAWWSGDRSHVRAWRQAGYTATGVVLGKEVTFARSDDSSSPDDGASVSEPLSAAGPSSAGTPTPPDLLLITCVKTKLGSPAAAKDLYVSDLFRKQRAYAEAVGVPWFILSAEHGLLAPEEWLAPYERYLPDTPRSYRAAWGAWVVARLDLLTGGLTDKQVEIHASSDYVKAVLPHLRSRGVQVRTPLEGLSHGQRLAWYATRSQFRHEERAAPSAPKQADPGAVDETVHFVMKLSDVSLSITPAEFLASASPDLDLPGLYSWWVDEDGASDLSAGLATAVQPGLIYAGLAGATRWPSGRRSSNTLRSRIQGMHLGGRHEFSTFRRSLGSALAAARDENVIVEDALTTWMHAHLRVVAVPHAEPDALGRLERDVLTSLDPPLNLSGMRKTPVRRRLTELRRNHR